MLERMTDRVDLLLQSPAAVTLLALLELEQRREPSRNELPPDVHPYALTAAIDRLHVSSLPGLLADALRAADDWAGPWSSLTHPNLPPAYAGAFARRWLAQALVDQFGRLLSEPIDRNSQEFWTTRGSVNLRWERFTDLANVYCCGEFPWRGLWTATSPHASLHDQLVVAWEMYDHAKPVLRWRYPVISTARVIEIDQPADWIDLVARYPIVPAPPHSGWELPGPNQVSEATYQFDQRTRLEAASSGHAARSNVRVAMPDWQAIAQDYDGIHLTWFGMLTCEGHVVDVPQLGTDVVTMLRYWFSERTLWLNNVFGEPEPLPPV